MTFVHIVIRVVSVVSDKLLLVSMCYTVTGPQTCGKRTNNVVGSVGNEIPGSNIVISQSNEGGVGEVDITCDYTCKVYRVE